MVLVIMGVSGSGKTTVGELLARKLGVPFLDADQFHPEENVRKMRTGIPLSDEDRRPWLNILAAKINETIPGGGLVLACSALKEAYRKVLSAGNREVRFVYLKGSMELILSRMIARNGHFMPPALLDSQFAALEEPRDAICVPVESAPEEICERIMDTLEGLEDSEAGR